ARDRLRPRRTRVRGNRRPSWHRSRRCRRPQCAGWVWSATCLRFPFNDTPAIPSGGYSFRRQTTEVIRTMKRQCLARYPPNGGRLSSYLHALPLAFEDRLRERCNGLDVALCVRVQRFLGTQACNRRVDGFVKLLMICLVWIQ